MKRCRGSLAAVLALGLFCLGVSGARAQTVCNFDDLIGQGLVPDGYFGIDWLSNWLHSDVVQFPFTPHSPPQRVGNPGGGEFFEFETPSVLVGAWFSGDSSTLVGFELFDASNNLVSSSAVITPTDVPEFLPTGYGGLVKTVRVVSNNPDFFVMDDVTFQAVPEPGPLGLLLGGSVAVGALVIRRRRR